MAGDERREEPRTLSERVRDCFALAKSAKPALPQVAVGFSLITRNLERCLVCGAYRMSPDLTGATCGNANCLAQMGSKVAEAVEREEEVKESTKALRDQLVEIIRRLNPAKKDLPENCAELSALLEPEFEAVQSSLYVVAETLGLDLKEDEEYALVKLAADIAAEVQKIFVAVEENEE